MSALILVMPNAFAAPLRPRRRASTRLPVGVVRFSDFARARQATQQKFKPDFEAAALALADWHRRGFRVSAEEVLRIQRCEFDQMHGYAHSPRGSA